MEIVRLEHVYKETPLGAHKFQSLSELSFSVDAGVLLAIAGPSGNGKSTLLNLIGPIDVPSRGQVIVAGHDISGKSPDALAELRAPHGGLHFPELQPVCGPHRRGKRRGSAAAEAGDQARGKKKARRQPARHRQPDEICPARPEPALRRPASRTIARALVTRPGIVLAEGARGG